MTGQTRGPEGGVSHLHDLLGNYLRRGRPDVVREGAEKKEGAMTLALEAVTRHRRLGATVAAFGVAMQVVGGEPVGARNAYPAGSAAHVVRPAALRASPVISRPQYLPNPRRTLWTLTASQPLSSCSVERHTARRVPRGPGQDDPPVALSAKGPTRFPRWSPSAVSPRRCPRLGGRAARGVRVRIRLRHAANVSGQPTPADRSLWTGCAREEPPGVTLRHPMVDD